MKNDQWFEPGEKVVRVVTAESLGIETNNLPMHPDTDYGKILCVSECYFDASRSLHRVSFVGVIPRDIGEQFGWYACCFRRVSEIQLCVRAAEKFKKPVTEEEEVDAHA